MNFLEGLNAAQAEAVQATEGPLLILAGPGSGKTRTLTHRIAYLIGQEHVAPEAILAVTFTNKAAREMRVRLGKLLNCDGTQRNFMPWMGTFHSICVKLLRIDGDKIGIPSNFIIYDEDDRTGLVKQAMKSLRIDEKELKPKMVSNLISTNKNQMIGADEVNESGNYSRQRDIAKVYQKYEEMRQKAGALDFDDLLLEALKLLQEKDDVRHKWQRRFDHILIDEYQDTNSVQYNIVKSLVGAKRNICVVGDDWQSIFSWRGADFTNILNFERDFKGTKVVKLEQNYRSTASILEAANRVISHNRQRTDKKIWTKAEQGSPVQVCGLRDDGEEANFVAQAINNQVTVGVRSYDDFAILYRTNAQSTAFERAFLRFGLPYQIVGGVRFYDRREIRDILAYLKLLYQPKDRISFNRIVNTPTRGIGAVSLEKFYAWQAETDMDIISALQSVEKAPDITPRARIALSQFGNDLAKIASEINQLGPAATIEKVISKFNYRDFLNDGTPQAEDRLANLDALLVDAQNFASLEDFLAEAALMSSADSSTETQKVTLMTLHSAKGLEFPIVFVVGTEEGILPHSRVYESGQAELEEERRLMYVGMTRAREELIITYAHSRMQYGGFTYNEASRFIDEIDGAAQTTSMVDQPSMVESEFYSDEPFSVGDLVRSSAFGEGKIIDVDGLAVTVEFNGGKTKRLNVEYARLEKI